MSIYDNSEVDLAIQRVNLAIAQSDLRNVNKKLAKATKSRTNYTSRNNQGKAFKPNGVTMPTMASPRAIERAAAQSAKGSPRAIERERMSSKSSPRVTERTKTKPTVKKKDTRYATAGILPALTGGNTKKFKDTFRTKGLLPALRGK
jgi:hypothetical protein